MLRGLAIHGGARGGLPTMDFNSVAQVIDAFPFEEQVGSSLVVREPVGVVAAITPWNYPLHQIAAKVAPALAAGCTVVLKPSEVAPLNAFVLAEIVDEVGLPPGVFNLVSGTGPVVGEAIASHPDVDMVSFTGSTRAGRRVSEVARRRGGGDRQGRGGELEAGRPVRRRDPARTPGVIHPAGAGPRLRPQGDRGGREAGDGRRREARGTGHGLLRAAHRVLRGPA